MENEGFKAYDSRLANIEKMLEQLITFESKPETTYLTVDEASDFICKAKPTIYAMVARREIAHIKLGKRLLFKKIDLIAFIEASRRKTYQEVLNESRVFHSKK
jgi:excisionase family DNA binding protein